MHIEVPALDGGDADEDLLAGAGVLIAMLEERIDPGGAHARDLARVCRRLARRLNFPQQSVNRFALLGQLYALDGALRREVGGEVEDEVAGVFSGASLGGLNPTLRQLGLLLLQDTEYRAGAGPGGGAGLLALVIEFLRLRSRNGGERVAQLLAASGAKAEWINALLADQEATVE
jgi:hypothetical protein